VELVRVCLTLDIFNALGNIKFRRGNGDFNLSQSISRRSTMTKKQEQLPAVAQKMLVEAQARLRMLQSKFGFNYGIVSGVYNVYDGELAQLVKAQKAKRIPRNPHLHYGAVTEYLRPILEAVKEDEIVKIPYREFHPKSIYSSTHSHCTRNWGKGSFVLEKTDNYLEVWRTKNAVAMHVSEADLELSEKDRQLVENWGNDAL
jgi:hypothetical protein